MRREGRQHGFVRTHAVVSPAMSSSCDDPRPRTKVPNRLDAPPAAGVFAKVSSKPTNHSKPTGRCRKPMCPTCHLPPAGKSKNKAKGLHNSGGASGVADEVVLKLRHGGVSAAGAVDRLFGEGEELWDAE